MSKEPPPPKRGKMRVIVSPAPSDDAESPTLAQLKTAMRNGPGVVRSSADARRYLEGKNYMLAQQGNTITTLTTILLSLVVSTGPCAASDRVPDGAANVIRRWQFSWRTPSRPPTSSESRKQSRRTTISGQSTHP